MLVSPVVPCDFNFLPYVTAEYCSNVVTEGKNHNTWQSTKTSKTTQMLERLMEAVALPCVVVLSFSPYITTVLSSDIGEEVKTTMHNRAYKHPTIE